MNCFQSKALFSSSWPSLELARESANRSMMMAFSLSDRKVAVAGSSQTRKKARTAHTTVRSPSRMNLLRSASVMERVPATDIHLQPSNPPTPSILLMANARRPENAPAIEADAKIMASLNCAFALGYLSM